MGFFEIIDNSSQCEYMFCIERYNKTCPLPVDYSYLFMSESFNSWLWLRGGGGDGVRPDHYVKIDFEIAVYKQTRAREQTFEGVPDSGCPRDSHAHIW